MKSIADGGLCHQFHYAGVVTKIISMIDETATRLHVEDRSRLMFATAERRRRVKLFRKLQKTADKIRRGPLIDLWRTPPTTPALPTAFSTSVLGLAFTVGRHYHQKGPSNRTPPLDPGLVPYCTSLRLRSQHAWRLVQGPS